MGLVILVDGMQEYFVNKAWKEVADEVIEAQVKLLDDYPDMPVLAYGIIDIPDVIEFGEIDPRIKKALEDRKNVGYALRITDSIFSHKWGDDYLKHNSNGKYGHQEAIRFLEKHGAFQHNGRLIVAGDFPCLESTIKKADELGIKVATSPDLLLVRPGFADRYFQLTDKLREMGVYYESSSIMMSMLDREAA